MILPKKIVEYDLSIHEAKNFTGKIFSQKFDLFNVREIEKNVRENTDKLIQMNRF
jgi:hypothetical protein